MSELKPSQIFAALQRTPSKNEKNKAGVMLTPRTAPDFETSEIGDNSPKSGKSRKLNHGITVTATGEISSLPDRCRIAISVHSKKSSADDAKTSVTRRLDYITQALHNHHVKENDVKVVKALSKVDGMFSFNAEVLATFTDPEKCQDFCNLVVEKLDDNVKVSTPNFFHSSQKMERLRRQACLSAVGHAKEKASEISAFLNITLGKVLNIHEESCREWEGSEDMSSDSNMLLTFHQNYTKSTFNVTAKISATFELKSSKNSS